MQSLNLSKGERLDITKGTDVTKINVALGWDAAPSGNETCDLDASVFGRDANGKVTSIADVVYFKQLKHPSGAIVHSGDELTGSKAGDDEVISFDLAKIPANIHRASIVVNIYDAARKRQNFGQVKNAFARIDDAVTGETRGKFDLTENYSGFTAIHVGDVYRFEGEWRFEATGQGKNHTDLNGFLQEWAQ